MLKIFSTILLLFFYFSSPVLSDEFDDFSLIEDEEKETPDPLYNFNKAIFISYRFAYDYGIKYVAYGVSITPVYAKIRLRDFAENAKEPAYGINHVLQARVNSTFETFMRFCINSTLGLLGFWDVASYIGLPKKPNDFGATMYFYGVPGGPYLFVLGPYNLRDTIGILPTYFGESYYFPMHKYFKQFDIVYKDSNYIRITAPQLVTLLFYSEYYRGNEEFLKSSFDTYDFIKTVSTNMREQKLDRISSYD